MDVAGASESEGGIFSLPTNWATRYVSAND